VRIVSIKLVNFQAHDELVIELDPRITTIKGPTDVGKSSVLRALRWLCLNDIAGEAFIKEGEKKTVIKLTVEEEGNPGQWSIKRVRGTGGSVNTYELDGEEFKAFGSGVPKQIRDVLHLNEINFQAQHDSPFWFNETAGEVSRRLNSVIDLSVIDDVLGNIASEVRRSQERIDLTNERLTEAKEEYEKLKPMEGRIDDFQYLKLDLEILTTAEERFTRLSSLITRVREVKTRITEFEEKHEEGKEVVRLGSDAIAFDNSADSLRDLIKDIQALQKVKAPPPFDSVTTAYDEWQTANAKVTNLRFIYIRLVDAHNAESSWKEKLRLAENKFHKEVKGKECPLCHQPLPSQ